MNAAMDDVALFERTLVVLKRGPGQGKRGRARGDEPSKLDIVWGGPVGSVGGKRGLGMETPGDGVASVLRRGSQIKRLYSVHFLFQWIETCPRRLST